MIEANEDHTRDWRRAYHTRIRDHRQHLEDARTQGLNRLSDREIEREAYALAEREVQTALNQEAEQRRLANLPRHAPEQDPDEPDELIEELPAINTAADLWDPGIIEDIDEL